MDEPTQDAVMQRLERMERESRRVNAIHEPQRSVVLQVIEPMDVVSLRLDNDAGTPISLDASDFGATAVLLYRDKPIWSAPQLHGAEAIP